MSIYRKVGVYHEIITHKPIKSRQRRGGVSARGKLFDLDAEEESFQLILAVADAFA
jgi:hypothetical protein